MNKICSCIIQIRFCIRHVHEYHNPFQANYFPYNYIRILKPFPMHSTQTQEPAPAPAQSTRRVRSLKSITRAKLPAFSEYPTVD